MSLQTAPGDVPDLDRLSVRSHIVTPQQAARTTGITAPKETARERASRLFLARVRDVPGVVLVETFGGETLGEQSVRVYVRDGDLDAEYGVYRVQGEVYDEVPEARLGLELLEESDIPKYAANAASSQ
jgi:hypothetical protein